MIGVYYTDADAHNKLFVLTSRTGDFHDSHVISFSLIGPASIGLNGEVCVVAAVVVLVYCSLES